jgi:flagellar basal body L-ring protein FlgH
MSATRCGADRRAGERQPECHQHPGQEGLGRCLGVGGAFVSPSWLPKLSATGSSNNTFEGKGSTDTSNDFSGTITASVIGVLPNGHLLIAGEKQVGVNHNVDTLRFTGEVDPRAIQPGNTVQSARIANVRVQHKGKDRWPIRRE